MTDASQTTPAMPAAVPVTGPSGLGGWLILPMLGLFAALAIQVYGLSSAGATFSGLDGLTAMQSQTIVIEFVLNLAIFLAAPVVLLIMMFGKKRNFPRYYIIWQIVGAVFVVLDLFVAYAVFQQAFEQSGTPFFDEQTIRSLLSCAVGVCIWIPYMVNSVRVKNTFVN